MTNASASKVRNKKASTNATTIDSIVSRIVRWVAPAVVSWRAASGLPTAFVSEACSWVSGAGPEEGRGLGDRLLDIDRRDRFRCKSIQRLFGYRGPQEALGQPITLLLPTERILEEEQILREY